MESLESTALEIYDSEARKHFLSDIVRILRDWKTVFAVALVELNNRYKKTALGAIWSILNPLLTSLIVYFIFGRLFNGYLPGERGYFFWVFSGFMLQIYLLQGIIIVTNQILGNLNLITNYRVNPLLISFSAGLSTSFNFLIGSLALVPAALISGHAISPRIFFVPLFALMVTMFISG